MTSLRPSPLGVGAGQVVSLPGGGAVTSSGGVRDITAGGVAGGVSGGVRDVMVTGRCLAGGVRAVS